MRGQTTDVLVECKIDRGAEVNVKPLRVNKHLFPEQKDIHGRPIALQKSKDAELVIHPSRRVPESVKDAVKKELKRMIEIDGIEKVDQPTDWVNSVVIKFVGNYHSSNGLEPGPDKIAAIDDMATPKYSQELQNVLGMVNYLSCYTPDLVIPAASTTVTSTRTS
ncbi:hypothetical protein NP493_1728g00027 [Ridgeia piscesae]|uniref:Uncharacterized protein n=1 Tax=Ridgeia piscesae TaxID=27915 RepID=A0AAD9JUT2_RIDPI|nr:hypothetical protein NP493_1728g00027 [Ridgeia piscesae]